MELKDYVQYTILVLAASTTALQVWTGLVTSKKWKKRINIITLMLIVGAMGAAAYDAWNKSREDEKAKNKQLEIVNTAHATLKKVSGTLDSIRKVSDKMDTNLYRQNHIINQQEELSNRSQKIIGTQQALIENSARALSPLVPMYLTVYAEFPMDQQHLDSLNERVSRHQQALQRIADSVERRDIENARFSKNGRRAYGFYESPSLFTVRISDYSSPILRNTLAGMIANGITLFKGGLKKLFEDDGTLTLESGYDRGANAATKLQVDWNRRKYLLTIRYLVEEITTGLRNGQPVSFGELKDWNLHFANWNFDYRLRMVTFRSRGGLVKNCTLNITEKNVIKPYSFIEQSLTFKEYVYKIRPEDFTTIAMEPFP